MAAFSALERPLRHSEEASALFTARSVALSTLVAIGEREVEGKTANRKDLPLTAYMKNCLRFYDVSRIYFTTTYSKIKLIMKSKIIRKF